MMLPKTPTLSNLRDRGGSVESRLINCPPFAIFGRVGRSFAEARPFFATAGRDPACNSSQRRKLAGTFSSQLLLSGSKTALLIRDPLEVRLVSQASGVSGPFGPCALEHRRNPGPRAELIFLS